MNKTELTLTPDSDAWKREAEKTKGTPLDTNNSPWGAGVRMPRSEELVGSKRPKARRHYAPGAGDACGSGI